VEVHSTFASERIVASHLPVEHRNIVIGTADISRRFALRENENEKSSVPRTGDGIRQPRIADFVRPLAQFILPLRRPSECRPGVAGYRSGSGGSKTEAGERSHKDREKTNQLETSSTRASLALMKRSRVCM